MYIYLYTYLHSGAGFRQAAAVCLSLSLSLYIYIFIHVYIDVINWLMLGMPSYDINCISKVFYFTLVVEISLLYRCMHV